jgi:hypothetical protein
MEQRILNIISFLNKVYFCLKKPLLQILLLLGAGQK